MCWRFVNKTNFFPFSSGTLTCYVSLTHHGVQPAIQVNQGWQRSLNVNIVCCCEEGTLLRRFRNQCDTRHLIKNTYVASIITLKLVLLVRFYGDEYMPRWHIRIVVCCTPIQLHNLHDIVRYQLLDGVEVHSVSIFSFR
jgi:hypothetical protein